MPDLARFPRAARRPVPAWRTFGLLVVALAAAPLNAQPANDLCASAETVTAGIQADGTNVGATPDLGESPCSFGDDKDVWYKFRSQGAGTYRFQFAIDIFTSLDETSLAIYSACGGAMLACADEPGPDRIDLVMAAAQDVWVRVAGTLGATGTFHLDVDQAPPPPANDECQGAIALPLNQLEFVDSYESTPSSTASSCLTGQRDVWFDFTAPAAGTYHVLIPESQHFMSVHRGGCQAQFEVFCDHACGEYSRASVVLNANQSIRIRAGACAGFEINFAVRVDNYAQPANDDCSAPALLSPGSSLSGTTRGATGDLDPTPDCGPRDFFDVWYSFTNPAPSTLVYHFDLSAVGGGFDPALTVLDACLGTPLACDDNSGPGLDSGLSIALSPGQTVLLRVGGLDVSDGDFTLTASMGMPPAPNDECSGAIPLSPGSSIQGSTSFATGAGDVLTPCGYLDEVDVWYSLTNTAASVRIFSIDTVGSTALDRPTLAALDACSGNLLGCNTNHYLVAPQARLDVAVAPAQTVFVRVSAEEGAIGGFLLNTSAGVAPPAPPPNDDCDTALAVTLPYSAQIAVGAAQDDLSTLCPGPFSDPASGAVWYTFTPAHSGKLLVREDSPLRLTFSLQSGPCSSLTPVECVNGGIGLIRVQGGVAYHLLVCRLLSDVTSPLDVFAFTLALYDSVTPGETCAAALPITLPAHGEMYTGLALNEGLADAPAGSCNSPEARDVLGMNHSVYLAWTAPAAGTLAGVVTPFYNNEILVVYSGLCGGLTEVACADEPQPMSFSVNVAAGTQYIVQVGSFGFDWVGDQILFDIAFTPACPGDFNGSGAVTVQDIFDFLAAYFSGNPQADVNGSGSVTVQDIFDFLAAYFAGCP